MDNPYILPKTIKPIKYDLEIKPNFDNFNFNGEEIINLNVIKEAQEIIINSRDLEITEVFIDNIKAIKIIYNVKTQTATFFFKEKIKKGNFNLKIKFNGKVSNSLRGFYKSTYVLDNGSKKTMLTTQFEANDARSCFPCFDEPELKAKFNITLIIPKDLDAVSNMPVKSESFIGNSRKLIFQETPIMSTYLVAFVISELEYLEGKTKDNTLVRIITTPGKKDKAKFALDITIKCLEYYNSYFGIPYPISKLDMIAIPDFESGAMENWGLITYRETQLLFDEKNSPLIRKKAIATTVAHEIAHQWFGDLVTMKWWDDLWLNEGFASWISFKIIDKIFPEWNFWTQFYDEETLGALALDCLQSTHKIEVEVINPDEISQIFDEISYNKGASVIRMLEEYLGEEVFRKGLQDYMKSFIYSNTTTEDLWNSLEKISKKPVKNIMDTWTKQPGYPVIIVSQENKKLKLKQERFLYLRDKKFNTKWHIPIAVSQNDKIIYFEMKDKEFEINIKDVKKINNSQVGFYRVNYDEKLFNSIIDLIKKNKLNDIDKLGIENNLYALARGNYKLINNFLDIIKYYNNENNYLIWADISGNLSKLEFLFLNKIPQEKLDSFIIKLFSKIYSKLGWDEKKDESYNNILLRSVIISSLGFSNHKGVLKEAEKRFKDHLKNKNLNPNLRTIVYSLNSYIGDKKTFEQLKKLYREEKLQEEKVRLLASMSMFKQKEILKEVLKFNLSKEVRDQDLPYAIAYMSGNIYSGDLTWDFFKENYKELMKRFEGGHTKSHLIKSICYRFSTLEKYKEIEEFFKKNITPNASLAIQQSLEAIKVNYNFVKNNEKALKDWLKNYNQRFK